MDFNTLLGKTLIEVTGAVGDDVMVFKCTDGSSYQLHHYTDCCESVSIEDIHGDLTDIVGAEILLAEESTSDSDPEGYVSEEGSYRDSYTWTFYRLTTIKGSVVIRWLGESNGYYSESVDFDEIKDGVIRSSYYEYD